MATAEDELKKNIREEKTRKRANKYRKALGLTWTSEAAGMTKLDFVNTISDKILNLARTIAVDIAKQGHPLDYGKSRGFFGELSDKEGVVAFWRIGTYDKDLGMVAVAPTLLDGDSVLVSDNRPAFNDAIVLVASELQKMKPNQLIKLMELLKAAAPATRPNSET